MIVLTNLRPKSVDLIFLRPQCCKYWILEDSTGNCIIVPTIALYYTKTPKPIWYAQVLHLVCSFLYVNLLKLEAYKRLYVHIPHTPHSGTCFSTPAGHKKALQPSSSLSLLQWVYS